MTSSENFAQSAQRRLAPLVSVILASFIMLVIFLNIIFSLSLIPISSTYTNKKSIFSTKGRN